MQLLCVGTAALAAVGAVADAAGPVPGPPACQAAPPRPAARPPAAPAAKATPLQLQNFVYCSPAPVPVAPASATASATAPPSVCPPPAPVEKCTVDPANLPTSVEINLGKGIGLKFQSAGWLAWVLTGLCVLAALAALVQVLRSGQPTPAAGGAAPARGWAWLAALLALVLGLLLGLALAPGPQLTEAQLRELQASPQFKAAMVELVEAKAEAARLRERVAALELAARPAVPVVPPAPTPAEQRTGGYDPLSLVLGAALAAAMGLAWFTRWVQDNAQMRAVLQAIGAAVAAAGVGRTAPEPVPPSAETLALATVRRLLGGRWRVPGESL
ncbi:hypothetical protein GCM10007320_40590 [Pseudorhodoferax aquiterrae]|uniref:Uncharacterized protein n=1 Tax=Pseudorhodoferax aquiterrae TaxID=747304 RepID=A0ABQ3G6D9_9BURK|nr:hypothetical protein [Pseudorhodoferax aquiterrae]GHC91513.1 hypothetical protein GCM10007320_40590 [Pseudorhodoferax aquiterrae]